MSGTLRPGTRYCSVPSPRPCQLLHGQRSTSVAMPAPPCAEVRLRSHTNSIMCRGPRPRPCHSTVRRWEEAEPRESTFTGPEERLDFAAVLLSVVCFGKAGGAQTQGLRHGESALTTKLYPRPPNSDGCPQAWVVGLESRVGRDFGCCWYRCQGPVPV